jgi:putative transposase
MAVKFQNKYRIETTRLQSWNYAACGAYFVTICCKNRANFFGFIENGVMNLSEIGKIAYEEWIKTPEIRPDMNLELGAFVVMPNHFHAILIIGNNEYNKALEEVGNSFGTQTKNLASIMRGFKSAVTTQAKKRGYLHFGWQSLYHEHIIRNGMSFENIQNYIINNPEKWESDRYATNGLSTG